MDAQTDLGLCCLCRKDPFSHGSAHFFRWFGMMEIQMFVALFFLKFDVTAHDKVPDYVSTKK